GIRDFHVTGVQTCALPISQYLDWLTTSKNGQDERDAKNNHGTWWVTQVAEFATFTGEEKLLSFCRDRFKTVFVPNQIAADGSFQIGRASCRERVKKTEVTV